MHFEQALLLHIFIMNGEIQFPLSSEEIFAYLNQKGKVNREHFDYARELYEKYTCFSIEQKRKVSHIMKVFEGNAFWIQTREEPKEDKTKRFSINAKRYEEAMNEIFEEIAYEYNNISPILLGIKSMLKPKISNEKFYTI
ncbi:hypothetical protein [Bacillus cereus group sp. BfR-BA-01380]|uniref:hypothetical protein n=1 Tax=Bacillus cereus group sp. BfR-BA-01380 TaxID=2920324 RepID=UPI001F5AC85A|nr:hypothetical protein [Bacillus cereus group sp. BfR-BA-01380]